MSEENSATEAYVYPSFPGSYDHPSQVMAAFEGAVERSQHAMATAALVEGNPGYIRPAYIDRVWADAAVAAFGTLYGVNTRDAFEMVVDAIEERAHSRELALEAVKCDMSVPQIAKLPTTLRFAEAHNVPIDDVARWLRKEHDRTCPVAVIVLYTGAGNRPATDDTRTDNNTDCEPSERGDQAPRDDTGSAATDDQPSSTSGADADAHPSETDDKA